MRKIKHYKVNKDNSLMLAVSFVKNPAIESKFLALEKEEEKQKYVTLKDDYRRVVYGPILRPEFPIYRNDGNEEYYLEFDKEAIEVLAEKYMMQGRIQNFTEAHKNDVEDVSVIEVWTKADMIHDKSIALGLDPSLEVGTLFFGAKVNNDEVWQKVLDGSYAGYSIEAIVGVDELQFEEQTPTETVTETPTEPVVEVKESVLDKILNFISPKPKDETPNEPLSEPQEPSNDEGEIIVPQEEEKPIEEPKTEPIVEEPKPNPLEELVKTLNDEIKALKESNASLQDKISGLEKMPSAKPIDTNAKPNAGDIGVNGSAYQAWREKMRQLV